MHKLQLPNLHIDQQDLSQCLFMARCAANQNMLAKLSRSVNQPQSASKLVLQTWSHTLAGCSHAGGRACRFCLPRYLPLRNCGLSCLHEWYLTYSAKMRCPAKRLLRMLFTWTWANVQWKVQRRSWAFCSEVVVISVAGEREKRGMRWMRAVEGRLAQLCPARWCFRCGI